MKQEKYKLYNKNIRLHEIYQFPRATAIKQNKLGSYNNRN